MNDRSDGYRYRPSRQGSGPRTLVDLLRERSLRRPDSRLYTFVTDSEEEGDHITVAELDCKARAIGALLQQSNASGQRALLLYPPGLEFITAFFGCLYANVTGIPAPPPNPARLKRTLPRLQAIARDARVTVGLTTSQGLAMMADVVAHAEELQAIRWVATDDVPSDLGDEWEIPQLAPDGLAYLQYTSGSTATPKGVMVSHANVLCNSQYIRQSWGYERDSVSVVWIPYYHDDGLVHGILQPIFSGYQAYLMSPLSFIQQPVRWLRAISRYRATHSGGPNFSYELCVRKITADQREKLDLSCWRMAYNAAEPVRLSTLQRFAQAFEQCGFRWGAFYPSYGLAEATLLVSTGQQKAAPLARPAHSERPEPDGQIAKAGDDELQKRTEVGCGHAVGKANIVIADPGSMARCSPNQVGEIWIQDPCVAKGYWDRPEETARTFGAHLADTGEGPFLRTGDLGFLSEGELFVTGRLKDLIIIRGQNHYPQDFEWTTEQSHPLLRPGCSAAFSVDVAGEERLVIATEVDLRNKTAVSRTGGTDFEEVIGVIRQAVVESHDVQPYTIVLLEPGTIPKTSSGKIQRNACRNEFLGNSLSVVAQWVQRPTEAMPTAPATWTATDPPKPGPSAESIQAWLTSQIARRLAVEPADIDIRVSFARYGLDSREAVGLAGDLEVWLGRRLPPTLVYEYPSIRSLAAFLSGEPGRVKSADLVGGSILTDQEPIAIIGIGCRFPGAQDAEAFWQLLRDGVDAVSEVPTSRWNLSAFYDPDAATPGKISTKWGGFLDQIDQFDPHFFNISPREAARMDPQQRLLLEVAWEALADAGQVLDDLAGTRTGVFVGISTNEYGWLQLSKPDRLDAHWGTGNSLSIAANRLSYTFHFRGPSLAVDTACSSSLVGVHLACRSLWSGESTLALAGGVSLILTPAYTINFSKAGVMARDGRCKTFDARADGYVRGEGAGLVVLKPLSKALADCDPVYAVIRGSAVNNDGHTNGLMAPSQQAQEAVLREAYRQSGVSPGQVQYVEVHGTGTLLGDPIEAAALGSVLSDDRLPESYCAIGSVKTNIGHLEAAAGVAGLIKVALALKHRAIPATLNFESPNPHIPFDKLPLRVQQSLAPWPDSDGPALAGVSSFGFGGTNAHVVLESIPQTAMSSHSPESRDNWANLLTLSAHTHGSLQAMARRYLDFLAKGPEASDWLADVCYAASVRQNHHDFRLALLGNSKQELIERLDAFLRAEARPGICSGRRVPGRQPKLVFVFPGQGSQCLGMGRELLAEEPVFREAFERCDQAFRLHVDWSLLEILSGDAASLQLDKVDIVQPAIFAIQVALAAQWRAWGIRPSAIVGQSMGEVAAAHVAGALSLDDAARVICHRSRLLKQVSGRGQMAAVELSVEECKQLLFGYQGRLSIASSNGPASTVLSGEPAALEEILERLRRRGIFCRLVNVDVASHSPQVEPLHDELLHALEGLKPRQASVPIYSTVTGKPDTANCFDALYWWRNLREPVLVSTAIEELLKNGHELFLEISPHPILRSAIQQVAYHLHRESTVLASLRRDEQTRSTMLESLGTLYALGHPVDWTRLYPAGGRFVRLPSYPWQRERCWLESSQGDDGRLSEFDPGWHATESHSFLNDLLSAHPTQRYCRDDERTVHPRPGQSDPRIESSVSLQAVGPADDWFYRIEWRRQARRQQELAHNSLVAPPAKWLIFSDSCGVGTALRLLLESRGGTCVTVSPGKKYQIIEPTHYQLNPECSEDFERLFNDTLNLEQSRCCGIVYLWSLERRPQKETTLLDLEAAQVSGCIGVLHLLQALARHKMRRHEPESVERREYHPRSNGSRHTSPARLWVVTSRAQAVEGDFDPVSIAQSPLWGLSRTIQMEYPDVGCTSIDMSATDDREETESLFEEILLSGRGNQVALRGASRYVAELVRYPLESMRPPQKASTQESFVVPGDHPFLLQMSMPGTLDDLALRASPDREPGPGEIQIRVLAAGLNFVDVLRALDVVPSPSGGGLLLGGECAGWVSAVGPNVTSLRVGDEVIAIAPGCFGSFAIANAALAIPKPKQISFQEAATIPVAFLTASYALAHLGRLSEGERVLIHAASGGVGLAAVQVARRIGAEIFATAGSAEKREFLRSLGVEHVMDSRSLAFADEVLERTAGQGVDVVLNSLAGDAIEKGLSALGAYGRFVEIGKRDIAQNSLLELGAFQKNLSFSAFDLDQMCRDRPHLVGSLLEEVIEQVREGWLKPLPLEVFPVSEVVTAFRTMAQAKHVGKLVVSMPDQEGVRILAARDELTPLRSDATYLISGGTGGLGLKIASWMVQQGARHLALISRRGASEADRAINEMRKAGAQVIVARADVADEQQVGGILKEIDQSMPPLRGIIHAAGVLDDGLLEQLDQARFQSVMAPKVSGAWNLHVQTLNAPLDFFVLFSSAASILGSPGQANYAAANAFLDGLAHYRRALGLTAMSINWGPWSEVGLAARPDRGGRLGLRGISSFTVRQGMGALKKLLQQDWAQVAVLSAQWELWEQPHPERGGSSLLAHLINRVDVAPRMSDPPTGESLPYQALAAAEPEERQRLLEEYLCERVAAALGLVRSSLEPDSRLSNLGLDSLLAVELKHRIEIDWGASVPVAKLLQGTTIAELAVFVSDQLTTCDPSRVTPLNVAVAPRPDGPSTYDQSSNIADNAEHILGKLNQLSGIELDSLLCDLLAQNEADR